MSSNASRSNVIRSLTANGAISLAKFAAFATSGSGAMLSEALHSLVDCVNQGLLLFGLNALSKPASRDYAYGRGRDAFFFSLLSAVGMFYGGACVSIWHGLRQLIDGAAVVEYTPVTFGVLGLSFVVDAYVLVKVLRDVQRDKPKDVGLVQFLRSGNTDPFIATIILEDSAATMGVLIAVSGIAATHVTGNAVYDSLACLGVGSLMGISAITLARTNREFLLGKAVDQKLQSQIEAIILARPSVEGLYHSKSRWEGPDCFAYRCELDFRGSYFAGLLKERHGEDAAIVDLNVYAEDVTRQIEMEVYQIQEAIRKEVPNCRYIELGPHSVERRPMSGQVEAKT
jgi:zinc transporter 9